MPKIVAYYFDQIQTTIRDVELQNFFKYDKTNVSDNPGSKKVIVRQGLRRVECKVDHSKQFVSVMLCCSATGEFLPPPQVNFFHRL